MKVKDIDNLVRIWQLKNFCHVHKLATIDGPETGRF